MRRITLLLTILVSLNALAQLEAGSIAPDFTLEDWYGNTHNLYEYLNEDKTVFVEIFAAHCPGCWIYHQTHTLKNMYEDYGPDGTAEVMVLALEYDAWNGYDAFNGIGDPWTTQGNWLEGTPYPQFNVEEGDRTVFDEYDISYYPIVYKICPDKTLEVISTSDSEEELYELVQECLLTTVEEEIEVWEVFVDQSAQAVKVNHSEIVHSVNILNLQGQVIKTLKSFSETEIDVSTFKSGIYIFQFQTDSELRIEKLLIQ